MTNYKIKTFDKKNPIHFEVHSIAEAIIQFAYDYEKEINKHNLDEEDFVIEITKSNLKVLV